MAAFREALGERKRERVPLRWAETQVNLGGVLATLGERTRDPETLSPARDALAAAWAVFQKAGYRQYGLYMLRRLPELDQLKYDLGGATR